MLRSSIRLQLECRLQPLFSQERKDYTGRLFHRLNVVNAVNGYRERFHTVFLPLTQPCSDQPILRRFLSALPKAHSENKRCFFLLPKNSHKSIEKLFLKKLPRKRQVNDLYLFFFFAQNYFAI